MSFRRSLTALPSSLYCVRPVALGIIFVVLGATGLGAQSAAELEDKLGRIRRQYYVHVDTALAQARSLLPFSLRSGAPYVAGLNYELIGQYYLNNGILDSTRVLLRQARSHYDDSDRAEAEAASLWIQATLASLLHRNAESLRLSQEMAGTCERLDDPACLARAYWSMGGAFFHQDQPDEEQRYSARAIELLANHPDRLYYVSLLVSYAMTLHEVGQDSLAKAKFEEARTILDRHSAPALETDLHLHEGIFYCNLDSVAYGNELFRRGITYAEASGTRIYKALLLNNLAYSANEAGDYSGAIRLLREEMATARGLTDLQYLIDFQSVISKAYAGLRQYDSAFHYLQLASNNYREYTRDNYGSQLAEVQIAYETREKEQRITRQSAQLRNQRNLLYMAAVGFLICIVAAVALLRLSRILQLRNRENEKLVAEKETLIGEIHHRVKNNLQVISSLLRLQSRDLDVADPQAHRALLESQSRVQAMGLIHEKLYLGSVSNQIAMRAYLSDLGATLLDTYSLDDRVELYYDIEDITLDLDTAIPLGLIVNELITNALKYAFPDGRKGLVEIALHREETQVILRVTDDGIGDQRDPAQRSKTAFGTRLLELLSSKIRGEIRNIPSLGYGTEVRFTP